MKENSKTKVQEDIVLRKFEGEPLDENEFERLHIRNGKIVARHTIENGEIIATEEF